MQSLRVRLPLLISGLILVVLATFLYAAYYQVSNTLEHAGGVRAQAAAEQMANLLVQAAQQRNNEIGRVTRAAPVHAFLQHPSDDTLAAARQSLMALTTAGQPPVELWNDAGSRMLEVQGAAAPNGRPAVVLPPTSAPTTAGASRLHASPAAVFYEVIAEVREDAAPAPPASPAGPRLGFIVVRRSFAAAATSDILGRLVGIGASVQFGNSAGDVWTDFAKAVPAPAVDLSRAGFQVYRAASGQKRLGAAVPIRGTPWAVWVEFPHSLVVGPARMFVSRMLVIGLFFVAVAAVAARLLSARITTPLYALTEAAEAIAGGEYSRRVVADRRDEIGRLGAAFNAMTEQVQQSHLELEQRVEQRVQELKEANRELESFSYSVSHDLRAPVRHVTGFAALLEQHAGDALDDQGRRYLRTITDSASRMGRLIDDLLSFSRMGRAALTKRRISLARLVEDARREVEADAAGRTIIWNIHALPDIEADPAMLRLAFVNLLSNAVKYTRTRPEAHIEVGTNGREPGETVVFVKDDGVGFDMQYAHKLFGVFQRLHRAEEFDGTGIGLANVRRIVQRHGGRIWGESEIDHGATFYLSLPTTGLHS